MRYQLNRKSLFVYIFGGLKCVGRFFSYVAHLWFLRSAWIRTQRACWQAHALYLNHPPLLAYSPIPLHFIIISSHWKELRVWSMCLNSSKNLWRVKYTVIHFISISSKFGISIVVGLNGTLIEAKMRTFKCPIYSHDDANAKFNTICDETDYSVWTGGPWISFYVIISGWLWPMN